MEWLGDDGYITFKLARTNNRGEVYILPFDYFVYFNSFIRNLSAAIDVGGLVWKSICLFEQINTFSYAELRAATDDFDCSNKLGKGGFGPVFKVKMNLHY